MEAHGKAAKYWLVFYITCLVLGCIFLSGYIQHYNKMPGLIPLWVGSFVGAYYGYRQRKSHLLWQAFYVSLPKM